MDVTTFKQTITAFGGEQNVLGFVFDNNMKVMFERPGQFTLATHFKEEIETIYFKETDLSRQPYISTKHLENVQGILFVEDPALLGKMITRNILP